MAEDRPRQQRGVQIFRGADAMGLAESGIGEHPEGDPEIVARLQASGATKGVIGRVPFMQNAYDGFSLVEIYFKPNYVSTRHTHNTDCLYYVKWGRAYIGQVELGPGDGYFVPANTPYKFSAGPEGFELLEFRRATRYDQQFLDTDIERWEPIFKAAEENRELWESITVAPSRRATEAAT
jgi:mannose-6-phosphate isomerase-like protein (cupin superfamily)